MPPERTKLLKLREVGRDEADSSIAVRSISQQSLVAVLLMEAPNYPVQIEIPQMV